MDRLNAKNAVVVTYEGETHNLTTWGRIKNIPTGTLFKRYYYGDRGDRLFRERAKRKPFKINRGNWDGRI